MPLGPKEFENNPPHQIPIQEALQAAWSKVGQMTFQIDIMTQQLQAFEQENKKLKVELEQLKGEKPTKKG